MHVHAAIIKRTPNQLLASHLNLDIMMWEQSGKQTTRYLPYHYHDTDVTNQKVIINSGRSFDILQIFIRSCVDI